MSALAEALVAAQRRALAALEKAYAAGFVERDTLKAGTYDYAKWHVAF